ncbi:hypothetical protein L596_011152 [Steinernema carpocapsae]|uniref:PUM-HD domain-containing protein n=1 Tax=Steinernema carpocapsae TaxID=34508 RepID=A0A4V6A4E1_STECR|nr:hypothetical protein L596_011152 [Steinernema carpocapsae]
MDPNMNQMTPQSHGRQCMQQSPIEFVLVSPTGCIVQNVPHELFNGVIDYPYESIVDEQLVVRFALDRTGCQYLQDGYVVANPRLHKRLFNELMKNFEMLSCNVFANFLMQTVVALANEHEKTVIVRVMRGRMIRMCYNRYACRVVQQIIETAPPSIAIELMSETAGHEARLAVNQNANHVIQKFLHVLEPHHFAPMVASLASEEEELCSVMKNKYGCRVIQLTFERLSEALEQYRNSNHLIYNSAEESVSQLIIPLLKQGSDLVTNEYSNYVVQYVITADSFHFYRDQILREHVLGRVAELSTQKFASHVVEKAFRHALRLSYTPSSMRFSTISATKASTMSSTR